MPKPDTKEIQYLEARAQSAIVGLINLAEGRKKLGFNHWADPDEVREALRSPEPSQDIKRAGEVVIEIIGSEIIADYILCFGSILGVYDKETEELRANGEVSDSTRSFCELMYIFELSILVSLDILNMINEAFEYKNEVARNALKTIAETYKDFLGELRIRHDGLYDFEYL